MNKSDQYLEYARECTRWAAEARTDEQRQAFLEMAKHWMQIALHSEDALVPNEGSRPTSPDARH